MKINYALNVHVIHHAIANTWIYISFNIIFTNFEYDIILLKCEFENFGILFQKSDIFQKNTKCKNNSILKSK